MDSRRGGGLASTAAGRITPKAMDWRVFVLAAVGFLGILGGLIVLALPDPYEGGALYAMDASHAICLMDLVGLGLVGLGGVAAWGAGRLWMRGIGGSKGVGSKE